MWLIKKTRVYLMILGSLVFVAGSAQAGGVIEEWVARYNGPGNYWDEGRAIAVDGAGNIYVTGCSWGSSTGSDYATIKYDSAGNQLWVVRYNGPGDYVDEASAIALDGSGNIYVIGRSYDSNTGDDYATIKYDTSGNEIWVRRYNGPGNASDFANAVALDGSGNIYVTGSSPGSGTGADYATVKYDSAGNELWVRRYNRQAENQDSAIAIAIDGSYNVYVTGNSYGSGTDTDYATIKYDSAGNEQWVRRYNGPGNKYDHAGTIAVDVSGNIYVTGESWGSGTRYDYATIKYDPNGNEQWVRRYNGPGNHNDGADAIAVDGYGNIYVTGQSCGSGGTASYATIKYDSAGNELWVRMYSGPGNSYDAARDIAVDGSGNIYVTGDSAGLGTSDDYATIKYDSFGNELWVCRYDGTASNDDCAIAIVVDDCSNVYVTGQSWGSSTLWDFDCATIKYSQYDFVLTMQSSPPEVNNIIPDVGEHYYLSGTVVNISAQRFIDCPDVYIFDHWEGDVNDPNLSNTTVFMDADKTVTAVFVATRLCGDECHAYPEGDLNKDCRVNFLDIGVVANNWLECTDPDCD